MSKLSKEQFDAYLQQIRELAEGPFEEMQKEVEVTNKFPEEFFELARKNDLYRYALPEEYGGWGFTERKSCRSRKSSRADQAACACICTMQPT